MSSIHRYGHCRLDNAGPGTELRAEAYVDMSTRGADFLYRWISEHMPAGPIDDPLLRVTDMANEAMRAAQAQGITTSEIDEEIGSVYDAIIHALRHRYGGCPSD